MCWTAKATNPEWPASSLAVAPWRVCKLWYQALNSVRRPESSLRIQNSRQWRNGRCSSGQDGRGRLSTWQSLVWRAEQGGPGLSRSLAKLGLASRGARRGEGKSNQQAQPGLEATCFVPSNRAPTSVVWLWFSLAAGGAGTWWTLAEAFGGTRCRTKVKGASRRQAGMLQPICDLRQKTGSEWQGPEAVS